MILVIMFDRHRHVITPRLRWSETTMNDQDSHRLVDHHHVVAVAHLLDLIITVLIVLDQQRRLITTTILFLLHHYRIFMVIGFPFRSIHKQTRCNNIFQTENNDNDDSHSPLPSNHRRYSTTTNSIPIGL